MKRKGFTLAEVLITLAIIGVVAAMTIPALIANTDSLEMKTAYKKAVSILNQAVIMGLAKGNMTPANCTGCTTAGTDGQNALATFFKNYLNTVSAAQNYFYTVDGIKYTFLKADATNVEACGNTFSTSGTFDTTATTGTSCYVWIDVNGDKGANSMSTGLTGAYVFSDQYYAVVGANTVIPASNATSTVSSAAMYQ